METVLFRDTIVRFDQWTSCYFGFWRCRKPEDLLNHWGSIRKYA